MLYHWLYHIIKPHYHQFWWFKILTYLGPTAQPCAFPQWRLSVSPSSFWLYRCSLGPGKPTTLSVAEGGKFECNLGKPTTINLHKPTIWGWYVHVCTNNIDDLGHGLSLGFPHSPILSHISNLWHIECNPENHHGSMRISPAI